MKIKNIITIVCMVGSMLFSQKVYTEEAPVKYADFDDVLQEETPLEFSTTRLKALFKNYQIPTLELQGRAVEPPTTLKSKFNKSLANYIQEVYNKRGYEESLSQDGTHIIELLELGNDLDLDITTVYTCIRLFYNKIKACELIDDTVIIQTLDSMPHLVERFFKKEEKPEEKKLDLNFLKKMNTDIIFTQFSSNFAFFEKEPEAFINTLSEKITDALHKEVEKIKKTVNEKTEFCVMKMRLRQMVVRFFELALNKAIWQMHSYEGIWTSFLTLANGLQQLGLHGVIDHMDDLDDLYWSLVHRFCFFLDLRGSTLPPQFFEEVESDLESGAVFFLEDVELDEAIKTKKEVFVEALIHAKAKSIAFRQGILTDPIITN